MHSYSYLNSAKVILEQYDGGMPFAAWLKEFFKKDKKYGSRDRKQIAHLCYCFFRAAKGLTQLDVEQQIIWSLFLCSNEQNKLLEGLNKELNDLTHISLDEKLLKAKEVNIEMENIFPWKDELTVQIDYLAFLKSFLIQPDLFLRTRPGKESKVLAVLQSEKVPFEKEQQCIRLSNTTKVDEIIELDKDAVVQDLSSQRTFDSLSNTSIGEQPIKMWDCCAASGGKSLLFIDRFTKASILATDIRNSILANLQKRFDRAGIKNYRSQVHDASQYPLKEKFDVVVCDAPCSGSGTWSRTPEQLFFFQKQKIDHYSNLQKRIASNASKSVKEGGYFIYITCSVFRQENEEVVQSLQQETNMQLIDSGYIKGFDKKADTLFTALFRL